MRFAEYLRPHWVLLNGPPETMASDDFFAAPEDPIDTAIEADRQAAAEANTEPAAPVRLDPAEGLFNQQPGEGETLPEDLVDAQREVVRQGIVDSALAEAARIAAGSRGGVSRRTREELRGLGDDATDASEEARQAELNVQQAVMGEGKAAQASGYALEHAHNRFAEELRLHQEQEEAIMLQQQQEIETHVARSEAALQRLADTRIDANQIFNDGTGVRTFAASMAAASGALSATVINTLVPGANAGNTALNIINANIERNLQEQTLNLDTARSVVDGEMNLMRNMLASFETMTGARAAARAIMLERYKNELAATEGRNAGRETLAEKRRIAAILEQEAAAARAEAAAELYDQMLQRVRRMSRGRRADPERALELAQQALELQGAGQPEIGSAPGELMIPEGGSFAGYTAARPIINAEKELVTGVTSMGPAVERFADGLADLSHEINELDIDDVATFLATPRGAAVRRRVASLTSDAAVISKSGVLGVHEQPRMLGMMGLPANDDGSVNLATLLMERRTRAGSVQEASRAARERYNSSLRTVGLNPRNEQQVQEDYVPPSLQNERSVRVPSGG